MFIESTWAEIMHKKSIIVSLSLQLTFENVYMVLYNIFGIHMR